MYRFRLIAAIFFASLCGISFASAQTFEFQPGWNTFSTPKVLSKIEYSNVTWSGLTFYKYANGAWSSTVANTGSVKPLEGFIVYNANSANVSVNLTYQTNLTPSQMLFSKSLSAWWNVLGVTTTSSPFSSIGSAATMSVDFTRTAWGNNRRNGVNASFSSTIGNANVSSPEFGEAYAVFLQTGALYAWSQNPADETAPVLTLNGDNPMYVAYGTSFTDPGAIWDDAENGTGSVLAHSGSVNPNQVGTYYLEYRYSDTTWNSANPVIRTVIVSQPSPATATLAALPLSATRNVVVGSKDVEALAFRIQADDSSPLKVRGIRIAKESGSLAFANSAISAVKLYKDSVSDANLVKQIGGSAIASSVANFDSIMVDIAKNQAQNFVVTVSIVDDQALAGHDIKLRVAEASGLDVEDPFGNAATVSGTAVSWRTITVTGVGTLTVAMDNADAKADKEKSVLAGTTSTEVGAVKLTATNEAVTAKDITVALSGSNVAEAVGSVALYKADGSLIASKTLTTSSVVFEDVNYAVAEGSETIYVKAITNKIGKDQVGTGTTLEALVTVTDAEGVSSKKVVTATNGSTYSKAFAISSVRVSAVSFVDSFGGVSRATKLTSGTNNLAILAITADSTANTKQATTEVLKTVIDDLKLKLAQTVNTGATTLTVEKIGGNGSTASLAVSGGYATGSLSGLGIDAEISAGQTVYFVIKGSIGLDSGVAGNESVQVSLENLNDSAIVYSDDDSGASVTALRLTTTKLDGAIISD